MPRSTKANLSKDLLTTLDNDILFVEYFGNGYAKLSLSYGEELLFSEQDLVTLLNFVRENQK